jgi:alkylation response protein AidB-like acyl-CoA dehydrogenase
MQFALNEDQIAVRDMAREFAAEKIAPHAIRWDEEKHFPVDVMREAATLGIGGVYIRADLRGPSAGLPDGVGVHLDPQHGVLDDRCLWQ